MGLFDIFRREEEQEDNQPSFFSTLARSAATKAIGGSNPLLRSAAQRIATSEPAKKTAEVTTDIGASILRAPGRAITSVGLQPAADILSLIQKRPVSATFTPETRTQKFLFGEEPVVGIGQRAVEAGEKTTKYLESKGLDPIRSRALGLTVAPAAIAGFTALDIAPVGGTGKKGAQEIGERLVSRYGDDAIRALRTIKTGDQRAISLLPKALKNDVLQSTSRLGSTGVDDVLTKYVGSINVDRLNISNKGERVLRSFAKELEAVKGAPLKQAEVLEASRSADLLKTAIPRKKTLELSASIKATRDQIAQDLNKGTVTPELVKNLKNLNSVAADSGRILNSFRYTADPASSRIKENLLRQLVKLSDDTDQIVQAAKGVDLDNPTEVSKLYRQFVKPKASEIIEEARYINMLSSPQTHVVNVTSNAIQAGLLTPVTRGAEAAVDFATSILTGSDRGVFFKEVPEYYRGAINTFGDAKQQATEVLLGRRFGQNPDLRYLPTGSKLTSKLQIIPRAMEAMDTFFQSLIKGGETRAQVLRSRTLGVPIDEASIAKQASELAQYSVFRQGLKPEGQGIFLNAVDDVTAAVMNMRKTVPGTKWMIPFIQTPMNILKQGVEYSPLGVLTIPGSEQKKLQVARAFVGSMVTLSAWEAVSKMDSTWAAPTDQEEKELFYASGRKPYSIRVGDNWVSYSKLGPLAYPIAMAAAAKWNFEQDPERLDQSTSDKMSQTLFDLAEFFSDQSYVQGIQTLSNLLEEGYEGQAARSQLVSSPAKQLIPLSSLVGWVNRNFVDPIYRKAKSPAEQIKAVIPGLSKELEAYTTPEGVPSERPGTLFSALTPIAITPAVDKYDEELMREQGARSYWETIKDRSSEEKNEILKDLYTNDRSYYTSLLREIKWDKMEITSEEREMYNEGVSNGGRAQSIVNALAGMESKEQKNTYLRRLYEAGILTDKVNKQLKELLSP